VRLRDIEVGKTYRVKIPLHVDVAAWHRQRYDRKPTHARVIEVGLHYDVPDYVTWSGIAGTPRVRSGWHTSERADGVKVEFDGGRTGVIPCRNVEWEVSE
jgi:hypothetical protein